MNRFKNPIILILILLFAASLLIHLSIFFQDEYAVGIDAYYYATQVRYFLEHLRFASPDISLTLYYLAGFSLFGNNIVITNKIAISVLGSLLILPAYKLGKRIYNPISGFLFALLLVSCSFLTSFTFEYVKNLGGIVVFLFFLNQLFKWLDDKTKKTFVQLLAILMIVIFTHKLMAAVSLVLFFISLLKVYINNKKIILVISVLLLAVLIGLGVFVPNVLHLTDLYRLKALFTIIPNSGFINTVKISNPSIIFIIELIVLAAAPLSLLLLHKKVTQDKLYPLYLILLLYFISTFPFIKFTINNISFRLFLLVFIPSSLFISILIASFKWVKTWMIVLFLIAMMSYKYYTMDKLRDIRNTDYILYEALLPLIELPKDSLLVVHQGFDYFYSYHTKKRAFHYLPEAKHAKRPVYRLAYAIRPQQFERYLGEKLFTKEVTILPGFYYLMKEETWKLFISKLNDDEKKTIFTWRNPHSFRHQYMLRNQKFRKKNI